jgi:hypothetical protein
MPDGVDASAIVYAELANVFLLSDEAAALPIPFELLYDSVADMEQAGSEQPFTPLITARCRVPVADPFRTVDQAKSAAAWLAEVLAFCTRRPVAVRS